MEIDQNSDRDDGEIDAQAQPGQECSLICQVVADVGRGVGNEERSVEGGREEELPRLRWGLPVSACSQSVSYAWGEVGIPITGQTHSRTSNGFDLKRLQTGS